MVKVFHAPKASIREWVVPIGHCRHCTPGKRLSWGMSVPDLPCPNMAVVGTWFCAEHTPLPQAVIELQQIDRVWYIGIGMCLGIALAGIIVLILAIAGVI